MLPKYIWRAGDISANPPVEFWKHAAMVDGTPVT
jgi:hypothetical protein